MRLSPNKIEYLADRLLTVMQENGEIHLTSNVDTVLIAGRIMKQGGELLHVDWNSVKRRTAESRDHVIAKSGFKVPKI